MLNRILRSIEFLADSDIQCSAKNIRQECRGKTTDIAQLEYQGYIYKHAGEYYLTEQGRDELLQARSNPFFDDWTEFEDEVNTGFQKNGGRSELENIVLPKKPHRERSHDGFFFAAVKVERIEESVRAVIARYGYPIEKVLHLSEEDRILVCNDCGQWGVMRSNGNGYLKGKCTICEGRFTQQ